MTQQAREKAKKRLVELLKSCPDNYLFMVDGDFDLYESLADCLLENGVIVPPCKVGDTVYVIANGKIREIVVDVISWTGFLFTFNDDRVYVDEREAYYTREAAEQALKEREIK